MGKSRVSCFLTHGVKFRLKISVQYYVITFGEMTNTPFYCSRHWSVEPRSAKWNEWWFVSSRGGIACSIIPEIGEWAADVAWPVTLTRPTDSVINGANLRQLQLAGLAGALRACSLSINVERRFTSAIIRLCDATRCDATDWSPAMSGGRRARMPTRGTISVDSRCVRPHSDWLSSTVIYDTAVYSLLTACWS